MGYLAPLVVLLLGLVALVVAIPPAEIDSHSPECSLCNLVVNEGLRHTANATSDKDIELVFGQICDLLPLHGQSYCEFLVKHHKPVLVQFAKGQYSANAICSNLGSCPSLPVLGAPLEYGYGVGAASTKKIKDLTGPGITTRFSMEATDLGIPIRTPSGKTLFIFGDTFRDARVGSPDWRSPVGLYSDTTDLNSGIKWTAAAGPNPNYASQLLPYTHNVGFSTVLPCDTIVIDGKIYMWVMVNQGLGNVLWSEIQISADSGKSWYHSGTKIAGNHLNGMLQMVTWELGDDGYVYVYSTGFQRNKPIIMHRVRKQTITDMRTWEPWGWANNEWRWGNYPTPILEGRFGELSLRKVEGRWVLSWFNAGDYRIDAIVADKPWSDLYHSKRVVLVYGGAWGHENNNHVAQLYGGYIIPGSTLSNFHFVVSQWNTDNGWPYRAMQFKSSLPK